MTAVFGIAKTKNNHAQLTRGVCSSCSKFLVSTKIELLAFEILLP
jgi:hypothetical protein